jgi:methionyl aminopeptidase
MIFTNERDLDGMRRAGRIAGWVRDGVAAAIAPGITTRELETLADGLIREQGAESAFRGYHGYPGSICLSVNDEVVHGIPGSRRILPGDVVSLDVGVRFGGFVGDCARTVLVGVTDPEIRRLAAAGEAALAAGIAAAVAGNTVTDISRAVQTVVEAQGFSVVRQFVGHGIGRKMHEDPQVPNFVTPGRRVVLKAGMTLAIEPMVNLGVSDVEVMADGWTVRTLDRLPSVHFEHTVAVAEGAAEILTPLGVKMPKGLDKGGGFW